MACDNTMSAAKMTQKNAMENKARPARRFHPGQQFLFLLIRSPQKGEAFQRDVWHQVTDCRSYTCNTSLKCYTNNITHPRHRSIRAAVDPQASKIIGQDKEQSGQKFSNFHLPHRFPASVFSHVK